MNSTTGALPARLLDLLAQQPDLKVVSCILRSGPSGWHALDTDGHLPVGVTGVSESSSGVTVHFSFTATQVLGFTTSVDEFFASGAGLTCGASVGYTTAFIQVGSPGTSTPIDPSTLSADGNMQFVGLFL